MIGGAPVSAVSAVKDPSGSAPWRATVIAIGDVFSGRKLVTKVEASLNFLYNPNKFMDALELMMNALDIPFNVSSLASGETGLSYTEWCDSPENLGPKLRLDAIITNTVIRALKSKPNNGRGEVQSLLDPILLQDGVKGKGLRCIRRLTEEVAKPACKARIRAVDRKDAIPANSSSEKGVAMMAELRTARLKMDPRDQPSDALFCKHLVGLLKQNQHAHNMVEEKINLT